MSRIQRFGRPGGGDERVVIFPSRAKLALLAVGSFLFVTIGTLMVSEGGDAAIDGVLAIVFFGACGALPIWRLVVPRPVLVIDRQGIDVTASPARGRRIPWSEITGCSVCAFNRQKWVGIGLVDPPAYLARLGPVGRWSARFNLKLGFSPVMIPQVVLPFSAGDLVAEIEWFRFQAFGG